MNKRVICIFTCIAVLAVVMLSGCHLAALTQYADPWRLKKEDQGFYYYVIGDDGYPEDLEYKYGTTEVFNQGTGAVILGLVDSDAEIDELVIPETLGGYPVKQIGGAYHRYKTKDVYYGIDAKNIKKIVINNEIKLWNFGITDFLGDLILFEKIGFANGHILETVKSVQINCSVGKDYVEINKNLRILVYDIKNIYNTVIYKTEYGELSTYATILVSDNLLSQPLPIKEDNHTFVGWFTDIGTEWNFEEDIVTESMTLYAKWI